MSTDRQYLQTIQDCVRTCLNYKPKFGKGGRTGVTLSEFRDIYQGDPFYEWFGLDDPLIYTAHKTAGGMTSIYRQIGIGCERVFRSVVLRNTS